MRRASKQQTASGTERMSLWRKESKKEREREREWGGESAWRSN